MTDLPANVIRLDDRRPPPVVDEPAAPAGSFGGRHLRLVASPSTGFRLDVFLARGRAIMAEAQHAPGPAAVLPLHARPA
jgi:hypothetical protein